MSTPLENVGRALAYLRKSASLTEQDLGDKIGVGASTIHRVEKVDSNPTAESIDRHLVNLELDAHDLARALDFVNSRTVQEFESDDRDITIAALQREVRYWMAQSRQGMRELQKRIEEHPPR